MAPNQDTLMIRKLLIQEHLRRWTVWLVVMLVSMFGAMRFLKQFVEFLRATQI
jgi:hypothetical protein